MKKEDHRIVQRVLDGETSAAEFGGFEQRLREEPGLLGLYRDYALLQHSLCEEFEPGMRQSLVEGGKARTVRRVLRLGIAAAVVLAAGSWALRPLFPREEVKDVALVTFAAGSAWDFDGSTWHLGGATGVERGCAMVLDAGRACIALGPAASVVVEAPAKVVFLAKDKIHLEQGRAFFHVGRCGEGLTVTTQGLMRVGSDTSFGIEVLPGAPDEIRVVEGGVNLIGSERGQEDVVLGSGQSARISGGAVEKIDATGIPFATGLRESRVF
jgi:ferric-dicitrate binding protein FerR (iron transport regulator)